MTHPVKCSRPLLYNGSDSTSYSYWQHGTCFIVKYGIYYFAVSAKHNIRDEGDLAFLRIHKHPDPSGPINFNTEEESDLFFRVIGYHGNNDEELAEIAGSNDILDTVLIEIDPLSVSNPGFFEIPIAPIERNPALVFLPKLQIGERLAVSGFPSAPNYINYDTGLITFHRHIRGGQYGGTYNGYPHLAFIDFDEDDIQLADLDGFSGSPVFTVDREIPMLAGIVTRGSVSSKRMYFVTSWILAMNLMMADINQRFFAGKN